MSDRKWWTGALIVGALVAFLLWQRHPTSDAIAANPPTVRLALGSPAAGDESSTPAPTTPALAAPLTEPGAPASAPRTDRASLIALDRFQFESLPVIDGCIGPVRAERTPHMVLARFERISTSAASDVFVIRDVTLPPAPSMGGPRLDPRAVDCLGRLRGRQVVLPAKLTTEDHSVFIQRLTLLLPTQGGATQPAAQPH